MAGKTGNWAATHWGAAPRVNNTLYKIGQAALTALLVVTTAAAEVRFDDASASAGIAGNPSESWGAAWGELNGDIYPDLYTSNHRMPGRLLQNNGDGTFTDRSAEVDKSAAFYTSTKDTHGAAWADLDNDGDQDLLTTISALESPVLINNGGNLWNKRGSLGLTLGHDNGSRMPVVLDFNNDGRLDLKLVGVRETYANPTVFQQQADGSFAKPANSAGLRCLDTQWAQLMDINGTGPLELLCGDRNGFPAEVYDYSTGAGVALPVQRTQKSRDAISGDFDGNGLNDVVLLLGSQRPTDVYQVSSQRVEFQAVISGSDTRTLTIDTAGILSLSINAKSWNFIQNDGSLADIYIGAAGYHPATQNLQLDPANAANHGVAPIEAVNGMYIGYDAAMGQWKLVVRAKNYFSYGYFVIDSSAPITATNLAGRESSDFAIQPRLLLNNNGSLVNASNGSGLQAEKCISGVAGDFDNDMDLDLFLACRDGAQNLANVLYENDGSGTFTRLAQSGAEGPTGAAITNAAGTSESVVTADYDVDGFLDLLVTNGLAMRPADEGADSQLFHNRGNGNHWVELDLEGTASNRDGIGAKVRVTAGGITQYREQNGGFHRWSQNHMRLHVGLAANAVIDEIRVEWPSGATDVFTNVTANFLYKATEGATTLQPLAGTGSSPEVSFCGRPDFDPRQDQATFLWQDCAGDGRWQLRMTGGGVAQHVDFTGEIRSAGGVTGISQFSIEDNDVLDTLSDPGALRYSLSVWGAGKDGFGFAAAPNTCFTSALPAGVPVYLGADRIIMSGSSLDLTTGDECQPPTTVPEVCGEPAVFPASDQATFLWQDCDSDGVWHLRATAGGATESLRFNGNIQVAGGVNIVGITSIEAADTVDTLSDPEALSYSLKVWGKGQDEIRFQMAANACFTPDQPAGLPVYLGANRVRFSGETLNLTTGLDCDEAADQDRDGDGLTDSVEAEIGTNPAVADTDGGGVSDGDEFFAGTNPLDPADDSGLVDTDGDGLSDAAEAQLGTNPNAADSDGGGANDGDEVAAGTNPLTAADDAAVNGFATQFKDISVAAGIAGFAAESWGSAWGDYNGDGYPDLFTSNHRTPGRLFRNNGDGSFSDVSIEADVSKVFSRSFKDSHAGTWADIDNDGDQDLAIAIGASQGYFLISDNGKLTERRGTLGLGTDFIGEQRMPVFFDRDNNGLLDLKMVNWNEKTYTNTVYNQTAPLSFTLAAASVGLDCVRGDWAQFMDINGSGTLEMLCGGETDFPTAVHNFASGSGVAVDIEPIALVNDAITADFDNDLRPDLITIPGRRRVDQIFQVSDTSVELHSLINFTGTRAFRIETTGNLQTTLNAANWNIVQKAGSFQDVYIGAAGYQPANGNLQLDASNPANHGLRSIGNLNGLFIGYDTATGSWQLVFNAKSRFSSAYLVINSSATITATVLAGAAAGNLALRPKLLLNEDGTLTDRTARSRLEPVECISGVAGDFDNDMDQDIYLACRRGAENIANILYENNGSAEFTRVNGLFGAAGQIGGNVLDNAGMAESVTTADVDLDGFLDLLVTNGLGMRPKGYGGEDQLFRNQGNDNHWIQLDLVGVQSNRDGMGAKIVVTAGGVSQYREQNGGYHRWSQNHTRIHVGLADNTSADTITVTWPSGLVETYAGVAADQLYVLTEGEGLAASQAGSP